MLGDLHTTTVNQPHPQDNNTTGCFGLELFWKDGWEQLHLKKIILKQNTDKSEASV